MTRLVIVGGSDAGVEAALAARRQDPGLVIDLVLDDAYLTYTMAGRFRPCSSSIGPALVSGDLARLWIYLIAPPLGAIAAAVLYRFLRRQ